MNSKTTTIIRVRYSNGTHQTNTVRGQRASSTSSYEAAALALARKLHPDQHWALVRVSSESALQVFELAVAVSA